MITEPSAYGGCLLGLALGDALGAPYEGGVPERALWRLLGSTSQGLPRLTDDTSMSLDLAESLLACRALDPDDLAGRFAASYRWSRGYGPSTARLLKRIRQGEDWRRAAKAIHPQGSWGNGAAMRAPVVALHCPSDPDTLVLISREQARVTHAHPLGVEGAVMIAVATQCALQHLPPAEVIRNVQKNLHEPQMLTRVETVARWVERGVLQEAVTVRRELGNGIAAQDSCATAVYIALSHFDHCFEDMLAFVRAVRGDVDTISAMAGAIWGARHGVKALPVTPIEARDDILSIAQRLYERAQHRGKV